MQLVFKWSKIECTVYNSIDSLLNNENINYEIDIKTKAVSRARQDPSDGVKGNHGCVILMADHLKLCLMTYYQALLFCLFCVDYIKLTNQAFNMD